MNSPVRCHPPGQGDAKPGFGRPVRGERWHDKLLIAALWIAAAWVVWNFVHWADPSYRKDPNPNPSHASPRGLSH